MKSTILPLPDTLSHDPKLAFSFAFRSHCERGLGYKSRTFYEQCLAGCYRRSGSTTGFFFLRRIFGDTFRYGKSSSPDRGGKSGLVRSLEVPKLWFSHFYLSACAHLTALLPLAAPPLALGGPCPAALAAWLDLWAGAGRAAAPGVTPAAGTAVLVLLTLQVRRSPFSTPPDLPPAFRTSAICMSQRNAPFFCRCTGDCTSASSSTTSPAPR